MNSQVLFFLIKKGGWKLIIKNSEYDIRFDADFEFKTIFWTDDYVQPRRRGDANYNVNNADSVEGMLINLYNQDNLDLANYVKDKFEREDYTTMKEELYLLTKRMNIFTQSFNKFFESNNLKFEKIDDNNSNIIFKKNDKLFDTENFSKGEYHIFLGACEILRNKDDDVKFILIDEPETALHPNWQLKLLNFYKELSEDKQLIISTHSPFVISSRDNEDKVIILKRNDYGAIIEDVTNVWYGLPEMEVLNYQMKLDIDPKKLNILVAGKTDLYYLEHTIKLFEGDFSDLNNIKVHYCFKDNGGDGKLFDVYEKHRINGILKDNVWYVYDWDVINKKDSLLNKIENSKYSYIFKLKERDSSKLQIERNLSGIENHIDIPLEILNDEELYKVDEKNNRRKYLKTNLMNKIISELSRDSFEGLKDELLEIIIKFKWKN